jgi:hypothetical protein
MPSPRSRVVKGIELDEEGTVGTYDESPPRSPGERDLTD